MGGPYIIPGGPEGALGGRFPESTGMGGPYIVPEVPSGALLWDGCPDLSPRVTPQFQKQRASAASASSEWGGKAWAACAGVRAPAWLAKRAMTDRICDMSRTA